jgi:hypothetical protein
VKSLIAGLGRAAPGPNHHNMSVLSTFPFLYRCSGDTRLLEQAARAVKAALIADTMSSGRRRPIASANAVVCLERGSKDLLASEYDALMKSWGSSSRFGIRSLPGRFAHALGHFDAAEVQFLDAISFLRKAGFRPDLAWTLVDYSEMLKDRNDPGDAKAAGSALDEAFAIARELGMKPLTERIIARKTILKA